MPKFRKKPVVIEAIQYTGNNSDEILGFAKRFYELDLEDRDDHEVIAEVWDKLHSTWVGVKNGQWIIKGIQGEFYPCDEDVFKSTYEPVEE